VESTEEFSVEKGYQKMSWARQEHNQGIRTF
jgi:hypothetical protein